MRGAVAHAAEPPCPCAQLPLEDPVPIIRRLLALSLLTVATAAADAMQRVCGRLALLSPEVGQRERPATFATLGAEPGR